MKTAIKKNHIEDIDLDAEARYAEKFVADLKKENCLPAFESFFIGCVASGNSECVNLKKMYPAVYKKIHTSLKEHKTVMLQKRKR